MAVLLTLLTAELAVTRPIPLPPAHVFVVLGLALAPALACQGPPPPRQSTHGETESSGPVGCRADEPLEHLTFERSAGGVPEVKADWLQNHHCHVRVVDVREAGEWASARFPFGEHVPLGRVAAAAERWSPADPIVLVCRSGRRSARAVRELEERGFQAVASLSGGLLVWEAAGLPVDRSRPRSAGEPVVGLAARAVPRIQAHPPAPGGVLQQQEVRRHLEHPDHVRWIKAAGLLLQGTQSCVDGRDRRAVVGTPGGDAGELLLALAALEQVRDEPLTDDEVGRLFDAYLAAFGHFYMHTDEHALASLAEVPELADAVRVLGTKALLRHPPRELEDALLAALSDPAHVGCGHLRLILQHPDAYSVRPALSRALVRTALRRLWQGEAIEMVVLEGGHLEGAVVNVHLDREVHAFTRIPTVAPRSGDRELFVHHPEVSAWLRQQNAAFLFELEPTLAEATQQARFRAVLEQLGERHLATTLQHLASRLPVYEARLTELPGARGTRVVVEGPRSSHGPAAGETN